MTETELKVMAALAQNRADEEARERVERSGRDRHPDGVVDKRQKQILTDVPHRRAAQPSGPDDSHQIAADERDAGALHRDVGSRSHGDSDRGFRQRRSVVDAIAGHHDLAPFALQTPDYVALFVWLDFGNDLVDADGGRHRFRRRAEVASQHHDAQAVCMELPDCLDCGGLESDPRPTSHQRADRRLLREWPTARPSGRQQGCRFECLASVEAIGLEELRAPNQDRSSFDASGDAQPGPRLKP